MRWIRFTAPGAAESWGIEEGGRIREVRGSPFDGHGPTGRTHALAEVRIEVPFVPRTFYAAGLNYVAHIREHGDPAAIPSKPDIGYRAVNALIAHDAPVVIPSDATKVQYEGELAVVIGRKARHLSEADALSCVLGYTIGNDVSERVWQRADRTLWRAKNTDTFKPMGPWIETDFDLEAARTTVRLNGAVTTEFATNDMLFGVRRFIAAMTRYLTLHPGDVVWMGTDGTSPDLKPGDVVEVEISGIGTLRSPFVAEAA
ncbi:fumarylacetoacetate hydrolase family protein [Elioraea sp.]|uniref:fumarylacetoacetate hydrolase family protein n=1 Tax=Elioraea sp. TaxID=2185103 RepID=UPI003F6ED6FE